MVDSIVVSATLVISLTIALVAVFKKMDTENKYVRYYPLASLIIGIALGFLFQLGNLLSLIIGLTAAGTYDFGKQTLKIGQ